MPTSVRLDPKTESLVTRLSRRKGKSKSEVIREALVAFARSEEAMSPKTAFDALGHLIGCVKDGPKDLSERTGENFRALLLERAQRWSS
jgi:predicted DNA-binding protein